MVLTNFEIFDLILLGILIISISWFLYKNRRNLGKEGILVLYRTKWGLKLIDRVGGKYKKTLNYLSYVSIFIGYILMIAIVYLFGQTVYQYLTNPEIIRLIRAPPIAPLIPYFPRLFGLESFFPVFYSIYFIISILIVASVHEFAHGIFARRWGIRIKSTGFAFLKFFPAIFGAFVEQDEKDMGKKTKFQQMSILSAGVFANILIVILFIGIMWLFFSFAFTASGVEFDTYAYSVVDIASITSVGGIILNNPNIENILNNIEGEEFNKIEVNGNSYLATKDIIENQKENEELGKIILFDDAPAINAQLDSIITEINGVKIDSVEKLSAEIKSYSPGEKVTLGIFDGEDIHNQDITLGENPQNKNLAWVGIGFSNQKSSSGILGKAYQKISSFKKPHVYYQEKYILSNFIFYLLFWIILINFLVALMNMLPVGIFDGGRFFYLTILGITKSEKIAKRTFSIVTYFFLFLLLVLMVYWGISFIK